MDSAGQFSSTHHFLCKVCLQTISMLHKTLTTEMLPVLSCELQCVHLHMYCVCNYMQREHCHLPTCGHNISWLQVVASSSSSNNLVNADVSTSCQSQHSGLHIDQPVFDHTYDGLDDWLAASDSPQQTSHVSSPHGHTHSSQHSYSHTSPRYSSGQFFLQPPDRQSVAGSSMSGGSPRMS